MNDAHKESLMVQLNYRCKHNEQLFIVKLARCSVMGQLHTLDFISVNFALGFAHKGGLYSSKQHVALKLM